VLRRLDLPALARLARRDLPAPVDVVNLIRAREERFESYRWYGVLVLPILLLAGGKVRWAGRHEHTLQGEPQADKLLVVRYPNHRRFLAMTLNPYYLLINRLRERGIDAFEASFTHASCERELSRRRLLLAAHFRPPAGDGAGALRAVTEILESDGAELVYATRETSPLLYVSDRQATDPCPLSFPEVAFFDAGDRPTVGAAALERLERATDGFALHVYRREPLRALRPSLAGRW
jgi:uncharacterized protein (DUF1330 family)